MKVVQINATYGVGSTGKIVVLIKNLLDNKGIENRVVCQYTEKNIPNVFGISSKIDMKLHALLSRIAGTNAYFSKNSTKRLIRELEKIQPTVVHLHNLHNNYINLPMLLKYLGEKKIKTVITLHDCWFFTGKCMYFSGMGCDKWKIGCGGCPQLKKHIPSWFVDRTNKMWNDKKNLFDAIDDLEVVGCSEWISGLAAQSLLSKGHISTIHNGIDTELFSDKGSNLREKLGLENKFVILGMANKWCSEENTGLLERIREKLDDDYHIIIVGKRCKNGGGVTYLSYIKNQQELARVYRTADVFVNVTYEDTLPTVNLEALGCGVPVITYDSCGSSEIVTPQTGYIVPKGDEETLLEKIKSVKKAGSVSFKDGCRQHILKNYNAAVQYNKYIDIYESNIKV